MQSKDKALTLVWRKQDIKEATVSKPKFILMALMFWKWKLVPIKGGGLVRR